MFSILGDIADAAIEVTTDTVSSVTKKVSKEVGEFVDRPLGKTVEVATQPLRDGLDVLDGLSEGEIRTMAIARLGADVVSGMAIGEVIDMLNNS